MRAEAIPVIRLEIDHMKHAIVSALGIKGSDLEEAISTEIEKAVREIAVTKIPNMVRETLLVCVQDSLTNYFKYGEGRIAIDEAIKDNFKIV